MAAQFPNTIVSSYSINGGFGWHELAARASDYPSAEPRDYYLISGYRTTNNTIWYTTYYWSVWWRRDRGRPGYCGDRKQSCYWLHSIGESVI